jgi:hypothetical protein
MVLRLHTVTSCPSGKGQTPNIARRFYLKYKFIDGRAPGSFMGVFCDEEDRWYDLHAPANFLPVNPLAVKTFSLFVPLFPTPLPTHKYFRFFVEINAQFGF